MDQGITSSPKQKQLKTLNQFTTEVVKSFYNSDKVNRVLPRKKDYIPVNVSGTKTQEEK
jgi:hypothetical protein